MAAPTPEELIHLQTEEALRESEERFRASFAHAAVGMALVDLEGRFVQINQAFCDLVGFTESQMLGRKWVEITHPDDLGSCVRVVDEIASGTIPFAVLEKRYVHRNGSPVWVQTSIAVTRDAAGRAAGIVALTQDITQRRRVEQELRALNETLEKRVVERTEAVRLRSEELARSEAALYRQKRILQLILDNMGDGVAVADESGRILLFTPAAERLLGSPPPDLSHDQWPQFFGFYLPDQVTPYPAAQLPLRRAIRGESVDDCEIFVRNPLNPQGRWISTTSRPIHDEAGLLRGGVSVIHDLSERKRAEEMLRDSQRHFREMAEHNRLLVSELEHRVRNNLASLLGLIAAMRTRSMNVDAFADAIEGRLSAMAHVDQLLSRSNWHAVDLGGLIESSLKTVRYLAPHAITEEFDGPAVSIPPSFVLPLTLILFEWFINSCKHGAHRSPGGKLCVHWEMSQGEGRWLLRLHWDESGGAPIAQPVTLSLGTELVRGFASRELRGQVQLNFPVKGVRHLLVFAIDPQPT